MASVKVNRGCPQGGNLSPLLWCIVIDGLLKELELAGLYSQGYADDLVILIKSKFNSTVSELLQRALRIVEHWCINQGLKVNPYKAKVLVFGMVARHREINQPTMS